ncbi:FMN-dependent NADH-azoreductase [Massilia aerilata]|uniref:FMN dependent NADH:quinone oxidoreductase n=1 Tax=Massilia aerilata TaxID=453817 RepID=A0ABW0RU92_9BURK
MNILRISCSPQGVEGESHKLSDAIVRYLLERGGSTVTLVERLIGVDPIPHIGADYANIVQLSAEEIQGNALARLSEALIGEVERADAIVIATPMHNLGVPSVLKAWIDHVVRAGRTFDVSAEGKKGRLGDRPVFVAIASGGRFSGAHARQPDFLTPYLKAVLGTIGLTNITFFSIQGTGLGSTAVENARRMAAHDIQVHFAPDYLDA